MPLFVSPDLGEREPTRYLQRILVPLYLRRDGPSAHHRDHQREDRRHAYIAFFMACSSADLFGSLGFAHRIGEKFRPLQPLGSSYLVRDYEQTESRGIAQQGFYRMPNTRPDKVRGNRVCQGWSGVRGATLLVIHPRWKPYGESRSYGSVRAATSDGRPYRNPVTRRMPRWFLRGQQFAECSLRFPALAVMAE